MTMSNKAKTFRLLENPFQSHGSPPYIFGVLQPVFALTATLLPRNYWLCLFMAKLFFSKRKQLKAQFGFTSSRFRSINNFVQR
jgi:hypothetical protein